MSTKNQAFIKLAFEEYLRKGGFPETFKLKNQQGYVVSLMDAIIKKDIADNFCREVVMSKLAENFGFGSNHTAENYYSFKFRKNYIY